MTSAIGNGKSEIAFTLIELLVVVTIIVVLLALLTPALDKAIYQAELAVCGTHLRAIASGANTYAAANKRYYPYRADQRRATPQPPGAGEQRGPRRPPATPALHAARPGHAGPTQRDF